MFDTTAYTAYNPGMVKESPAPTLADLCEEVEQVKSYRRVLQREFADSFAKYRKKSGLTLRELAVIIGVTHGYLSDLENDRRLPSAEVAAKIRMWAESNQ